MKRHRFNCLILLFSLAPFAVYANGGGPILLYANAYLFSLGQVWILGVESLYLWRILKPISYAQVLKWTFLANLESTILAGILFPTLLAGIGLFFLWLKWPNETISDFMGAFGTWIGGDNSPFAGVALVMSFLGFALTYFLSVEIEWRCIKNFLSKRKAEESVIDLRSKIYVMNLYSYGGLVAMFLIYVASYNIFRK